jgi:hypothetical protein
MNILYSISAYLFFILLFVKVVLHIQLDNGNGYKIVFSPVSTWVYLLPYDKEILQEFEKKKRLCNKIQKLFMYFLFATIFFLVIKIFLTHMS